MDEEKKDKREDPRNPTILPDEGNERPLRGLRLVTSPRLMGRGKFRHGLGTYDILVQCYDDKRNYLQPMELFALDENTIQVGCSISCFYRVIVVG